jgi:signal transduction histidine kinase
MALGLAASSAVQSTIDAAPHAFATLVGPAPAPLRQAPSREKHLLATVAHELRNPLASLRLSLELLVADFDDLEPEDALLLVRRAHRSASWLAAMTENLTSAACVDAGRMDTRSKPVELLECLEDAVSLVDGLLKERRQSVRFTCSAPSTRAMADRARTIQIVANLLTNASRYSIEGDEIELHVSMVGRQLRVRISDHGPGISPEDQQRIFGAWERGTDSSGGGLGLGLSIVQSLVQQQGGRVGVESTFGQGATFWFTVPASADAKREAVSPCQV